MVMHLFREAVLGSWYNSTIEDQPMRKNSILLLASLPIFMLASCGKNETKHILTNAELIHNAYLDSIEVSQDKTRKLICLNPNDRNVTWNEQKDAALMFTFHRFPTSYPEGEEVKITWGESWLCSVKELANWYKDNMSSIKDPLLRIKQLLGMYEDSANTYISSLWIKPSDMIRPAYVTDVNSQMALKFADDVSEDYKSWFSSNYYYSYDVKKLPWTRLGYTYDWSADAKDRYGLSEFVAFDDVSFTVEKTLPVAEFLESTLD